MVTDVMETAATMSNPQEGKGHMIQGLESLWEKLDVPASSLRQSDGRRACIDWVDAPGFYITNQSETEQLWMYLAIGYS